MRFDAQKKQEDAAGNRRITDAGDWPVAGCGGCPNGLVNQMGAQGVGAERVVVRAEGRAFACQSKGSRIMEV